MDLYEKRFNTYNAVLDLYQADIKKELHDITTAEFTFVRAFRESLFLFERQDGIYELMEMIKDAQSVISADEENKAHKHQNNIIAEKAAKARIDFEKMLLDLEMKLHKYLDVSKIK